MDESVETIYQNYRFQTNNRILHLNENGFFICSHPLPPLPKQCCKMLRGCLFVSNIEKGGRGGYLSRGEGGEFIPRKKVGNFHVSQHFLFMIGDDLISD